MGGGRIEVDGEGREPEDWGGGVAVRKGEAASAAEPRRCRRRIQRERTKKKAEGGGRVFRVRGRREADILKK